MKAFLAITVARQVEGDMIWVKVEKAHAKASVIDEYVKKHANQFVETMSTEFGPVECQCTRSSMEVEIEGEENGT
tara:strand:- start:9557 stop:9781 length:225 start_codon:yes stop_codon:yes gene_type:complete